MSDKRLGKGLGAIFGEDISEALEEIQQGAQQNHNTNVLNIPLSDIRSNPYQPREIFDDEKLEELAISIKEHGVFTPILVRESLQGYELVAGERRVKASRQAGLETIPAIIVAFNDQEMMEIALLENIQRENLSAIEEANAYAQLIDNLSYTQTELAERVGKSRAHIANLLRLLKLPETVQELIVKEAVKMGQVRPLLSEEDEKVILQYAQIIMDHNLSARNVERLVSLLSKTNLKTKHEVLKRFEQLSSKQMLNIKVLLDQLSVKQSDALSEVIVDYKVKDILEVFEELSGKNSKQIDNFIETGENKEKEPNIKQVDPHLKDMEAQVSSHLGTQVNISNQQIKIKYNGTSDLNRILKLLNLIDE